MSIGPTNLNGIHPRNFVIPEENVNPQGEIQGRGVPQAAQNVNQAEILRSLSDIHEVDLERQNFNAALDQHLEGAARPGASGFFKNVGTWFSEAFKKNYGLPENVSINMPGNGPVDIPCRYFKGMLECAPKLERPQIRENLANVVNGRLQNGHDLLQQITSGVRMPDENRATAQEIADITLYLQLKACAIGRQYDRGAMSLEDPEGKIARFFESCPDKYVRASTHLHGLQNMTVDGHLNLQRGIDFDDHSLEHGLPHSLGTVCFGSIPVEDVNFLNQKRRFFLKTETYGCNTDFGRNRALTQDQIEEARRDVPEDRQVTWGDTWKSVKHFGRLLLSPVKAIQKKFHLGEEGHFISNGEKVPKGIKKDYKKILELAEKCRKKWGAIGAESQRLVDVLNNAPVGIKGKRVFQIRDMVENIAGARGNLTGLRDKYPQDEDVSELGRRLDQLQDAILNRYHTDRNPLAKGGPLEERLGNEVMMNLDEVVH